MYTELGKRSDLALIILNYNMRPAMCKALWQRSSFRICADGGANRLYDMVPTSRSVATLQLAACLCLCLYDMVLASRSV